MADINPDLAPRPTLKVLLAGIAALALVAARRLTLISNAAGTQRYNQTTISTS